MDWLIQVSKRACSSNSKCIICSSSSVGHQDHRRQRLHGSLSMWSRGTSWFSKTTTIFMTNGTWSNSKPSNKSDSLDSTTLVLQWQSMSEQKAPLKILTQSTYSLVCTCATRTTHAQLSSTAQLASAPTIIDKPIKTRITPRTMLAAWPKKQWLRGSSRRQFPSFPASVSLMVQEETTRSTLTRSDSNSSVTCRRQCMALNQP